MAVSRSVTIIISTVVTVCVVCNVTAMATHVIWSLQMCVHRLRFLEYYRRFLANISNVMVTLNCAANFVIYYLFSRSFRLGLLQMFKCETSRSCCERWRLNLQRRSSDQGNTSCTTIRLVPMRVSFQKKRHFQQNYNAVDL